MSYKKQELLTLCKHPISPPFFWWGLCYLIMCIYILSSVLWVRYDFCIKMMFVSSSTPVVCRRAHVLLCFLCVCMFEYSNVKHFFLSYIFTFWVLCCDVCIKRCLVCLYLQLFVGRLMSYLRYLCLFTHSGVQDRLTIWVTWLVSYKRQELIVLHKYLRWLPVFGGVCVAYFLVFCIVFFVLCTQCCQFLWIVHSWLPSSFFSNVSNRLKKYNQNIFKSFIIFQNGISIKHNTVRMSIKH